MRVAMFCHSIRSCWNHGNAHFLRGVVAELLARGHDVRVFEQSRGWSVTNLIDACGESALQELGRAFPELAAVVHEYELDSELNQELDRPDARSRPAILDLDQALDGVDLVIVHEWTMPGLVARIGAHRARSRRFRLLFHDTHHRSVTDPDTMFAYRLDHYDGVLAFGRVIRDIYLERGWAQRAWTWHEAADTRVFRPVAVPAGNRAGDNGAGATGGDLVWIGNWGDEERTTELHTFLLEPVRSLGLVARAHGVRYPAHALGALERAGIEHGGWLPNHRVPEVFARYRVTVHIPRRPYAAALPGIPTIRPFEALACGIPLVCSPWDDAEGLFTSGQDYLMARDQEDMKRCLRAVLEDAELAQSLREHGLHTIARRHTCAHRVDQLLDICAELDVPGLEARPPPPWASQPPARRAT